MPASMKRPPSSPESSPSDGVDPPVKITRFGLVKTILSSAGLRITISAFAALRIRKMHTISHIHFPQAKKIPESKYINPGISLFYPRHRRRNPLTARDRIYGCSGRSSDFRIILSAASSHPYSDSDILRRSSPITAAGPLPIFTGFPFMLNESTPELISISCYSIAIKKSRPKTHPKNSETHFTLLRKVMSGEADDAERQQFQERRDIRKAIKEVRSGRGHHPMSFQADYSGVCGGSSTHGAANRQRVG